MTDRAETIATKFGRLAYGAGYSSGSNPFEKGTQSYFDWRSGWTDMALIDAATCGADGEGSEKTK